MRKILTGFLIMAAALSLAPAALAAEFVYPDKQGQVSVPGSETHHNLYAAGGMVDIGGTTSGDLTVAGGNVYINGAVSGELLAAGGNININAPVSSTARIGGGTVVVNNSIGGDLVVGGGNVSIYEQAPVSGDLVVGGGNVNLYAPVGGSARIGGGSITINSKINGNVYVTASKGLTFGPKAEVTGTVYYKGVQPAQVDAAAKVGTINYTHIEAKNRGAVKGVFALGTLISFIALLIVAFLFLWLRRKAFDELVEYSQNHFWAALGLGFVGLIVTPIAVIVLFVTLVGYYAAIILALAYVLVLLVVTVFAVLFLGRFILHLINTRAENFPMWQIVLVGAIAWEILKLIPIVGWLILAIVYIMTFGAGLVLMRRRIQREM